MSIISGINIISYFLCAHLMLQHKVEVVKKQPKIDTPVSEVVLMQVLNDSHNEVFGYFPSAERLSMSWAMVALENGKGKHMWNHNVGNIGPGKNHEYYVHSSRTTYRSFNTFIEGGIAYWNTIKRCSAVLSHFDTGNSREVSYQLKRCNYFGADVKIYLNGVTSLYWEATGKVLPKFRKYESNK